MLYIGLEIIGGIMIPFLGTSLGAAWVFFMKEGLRPMLQKLLAGFAAGVMAAASVWSLLIPAMEQSASLGRLAFIPAAIGFWMGVLFLLLLDHFAIRLHQEDGRQENHEGGENSGGREKHGSEENYGGKESYGSEENYGGKESYGSGENSGRKEKHGREENYGKRGKRGSKENSGKRVNHGSGEKCRTEICRTALTRTGMLVLAVTLHNIPEGMAVGVVFAGRLSGSGAITMAEALALSIGIAIQNIPEGAIISMPLRAEGSGRGKAFLYGVLSGIVEPAAAGLTVLASSFILSVLSYLLSFAAGAMIYVVVEELIPEMSDDCHSHMGILSFTLGFILMLALDVALG